MPLSSSGVALVDEVSWYNAQGSILLLFAQTHKVWVVFDKGYVDAVELKLGRHFWSSDRYLSILGRESLNLDYVCLSSVYPFTNI